MHRHLSPKQLALAIGASESSLKRWVDAGRIRAEKTAGGHRRVSVGEAARFIRESGMTLSRPEVLGLPSHATISDMDPAAAVGIFHDQLAAGQAAETRNTILSLFFGGMRVWEIADQVVCPAMKKIGALWEHNETGVYVEHRATEIVLQSISQLRMFLAPEDGMPLALGCAPSGDPSTLPSVCIAASIEDTGMPAMNLGADTPPEALRAAIERHNPAMVWVSVSYVSENRDAVEEVIRTGAATGVPMIIGGHSVELIQGRLPQGVRVGSSMSELVAFAREAAGVSVS